MAGFSQTISSTRPYQAPPYTPYVPAPCWETVARSAASFVGTLLVGFGGWGLYADEDSPEVVRKLEQDGGAIALAAGGTLLGVSLISWLARKYLERSHRFNSLSVEAGCREEGATYPDTSPEGIVDITYANSKMGFGFVVDGSGHNNPLMRPPLGAHFSAFTEAYEQGLVNLHTLEEITAHFQAQMLALTERFQDPTLEANQVKVKPENRRRPDFGPEARTLLDPSYQPAVSVAQVIHLKGRDVLLTAQAGDTMIVVQTRDGTLTTTQPAKSSGGVGGSKLTIKAFDITGARRVMGFSDGFGEFLTLGQLQRIVKTTESSSDLFGALKREVVSSKNTSQTSSMSPRSPRTPRGRSKTPRGSAGTRSSPPRSRKGSPKSRRGSPRPAAANGLKLKSFDAEAYGKVDDIGLFVLDLV